MLYRQNLHWNYRLVIKNDSNHIAKNVEFDIEEVIFNGTKRVNFLPAPLNWTHGNSLRDIFPHQIAYLDIIIVNNLENVPIALCAPVLYGLSEMVKIEAGTTLLKLKYYTENGKTGTIDLKVTWNGSSATDENNLPEISIIKI